MSYILEGTLTVAKEKQGGKQNSCVMVYTNANTIYFSSALNIQYISLSMIK